MVRRGVGIMAILAVAAASARADEAAFAGLRTAYEAARSAGGAEGAAVEFAPRMKAYAEEHAGKPDALPALVWLVQNARLIGGDPKVSPGGVAPWAVDRLTRDHAADPRVSEALPPLRYLGFQVTSGALIGLYEKIIQTNRDKAALAEATFNLAQTLYIGRVTGDKPEAVAQRANDKRRAKELFQTIVKEYAGTEPAKNSEAVLRSMEKIAIGEEAPDIVGPDADGKEIRMSQFRGKVVVLHFWGFW